jgi:glycosyltransferase involved in cell wall biosynthesis
MPADPDTPLVVHVDVTDTVATHWRAGIQRVVAQLVDQIGRDQRLRVEPVVWLESIPGFRTLTPDERRRLAPSDGPAPPTPNADVGDDGSNGGNGATAVHQIWGRVRPVLGVLRRALVAVLEALRLEPPLRRARRAMLRRTRDRDLVPLGVVLEPGSVLFELDTVWNNTWVDRADLYARLRAQGVHVAAVVYDLLPQQHPEWFEPSLVRVSDRTIAAQATYAELVLAISEHTATSFTRWATARGVRAMTPQVIALGADAAAASGTPAPLPAELEGARYVLTVGTVEPRKNHATLLDAVDRLLADDPDVHLVVVGRPGWHNEAVLERLEAHPSLGRHLHWYRAAGDDLLATLYAHARVVAVASITEGYGLPVIEAMAHGVPVVASDGGALVEAGGDLVDHVGALDVDAWVATLGRYLRDDDLVAERRASLRSYRPPTWSDTGRQVADALVARFAVPPR